MDGGDRGRASIEAALFAAIRMAETWHSGVISNRSLGHRIRSRGRDRRVAMQQMGERERAWRNFTPLDDTTKSPSPFPNVGKDGVDWMMPDLESQSLMLDRGFRFHPPTGLKGAVGPRGAMERAWSGVGWRGTGAGETINQRLKAERQGSLGGDEHGNTVRRSGPVGFYNKGGNVDSVPAMLTPGEFVMRKQSVDKYGQKVYE